MVTWTMTFLPIQQVILAGGKIEFKKLADILSYLEPSRFRDESVLEAALDRYISCLTYNLKNGMVEFNKGAVKYCNYSERSVQYALHYSIKDMEEWQLYRLVTRQNSPTCFLGINWRDIPNNNPKQHYDDFCDFRENGTNKCSGGCRVTKDTLRKYGFLK